MEWGQFKNFVWLWALPVLGALLFFSVIRRRAKLRQFGELPLVKRLLDAFSPAKRILKQVLVLLILLLIILALCQPHFKKKEIWVERKGIDVIIALDVSLSMTAKDIAPSRLERAKLELKDLIDALRGNRVGIVAFAAEAYIQCPLTLDGSAAKLFLSTVSPTLIPAPGTVMSNAILVARQVFGEEGKNDKVLILLTDGEDHEPGAVEAAKAARKAGIRIFTIGIGTPDGSTFPDWSGQSFKKDKYGQVVISKLNERLLKDIAAASGGIYYRSSAGSLEIHSILKQIGQISRKDLGKQRIFEYEENYSLFLLAAFVLMLLEMALSERRKAA